MENSRTMMDDFIISKKEEISLLISSVSESVSLFIACQFALESNYGTSQLATKYNNITGMRKPLVRPSTCEVDLDSNGFAVYSCKMYCIIDYFLCICYHRPLSEDFEDVKKYARFVKKFYCPEKDYIDKIMSIYNKFTYLLTQNSQQNEE